MTSCPICAHTETRVIRKTSNARRRECCRCKHRWTTVEVDKARFERASEAAAKVKALAVELEES